MQAATAEDAVVISFHDLFHRPETLHDSITKAFGSGPESLGIILVKDLPGYAVLRERLLLLANQFASLPDATKELYVDAKSNYSFGWSHGKEIMNDRPDLLKGSYYANPIIDVPSVSDDLRQEFPEYYNNNIWPTQAEQGIEGFEQAFKALGSFIFNVGCQLAVACEAFASPHLADLSVSLRSLIATSQTTKARLLHYFPRDGLSSVTPTADGSIDSWCGFHLDHSLLTGLCSAMYIAHSTDEPSSYEVIPSPSPESGLYIRTRGGTLTKINIPADYLAFQTGEALEQATEGRLRATPHCVRVGSSTANNSVSRETFAVFMQPDVTQAIGKCETFGTFSRRIFKEHYGEQAPTLPA
ncbi:Clavaminate synthase-like protein [Dacryopinax primogenitus]|uniref:Clavaminate synthase-like protein n=1 Tax=Dacryopinax primogenitus (strain DJM 731) TaxID=1858805 RepID=M5FYL7_DACPD|nr:Clavaminate synthase-like protein [Dacryopinax primogenitus]EJU00975.1 Clavaminate synthase-like protein [Dacryopinax primogenitus]